MCICFCFKRGCQLPGCLVAVMCRQNVNQTDRLLKWGLAKKKLKKLLNMQVNATLRYHTNQCNLRNLTERTNVPRKDVLVVRHTIIKICIESTSLGGEERSEGVERSVTIIPHLGGQESRLKKIALFKTIITYLGGQESGWKQREV